MPELLKEMLRYKRPHGSYTEQLFIEKYIIPLGVEIDEAGNLFKRIGSAPVVWSCHTDTVHNKNGMQKVRFDGQFFSVKKSSCLGADDGAGLWLMLEMIKNEKEGLYIFHRGEELGGIGSNYIASKTPERLDGIKFAIAFDRKGTSSIITDQCGNCCSDEFAQSMIDQMPGYKKDPTGTFTDTANYTEIVPECTNISVGYENQHSKREILDFNHLYKLKELMLNLDVSKLVAKRDPSIIEQSSFGYADQGWYRSSRNDSMLDIIWDNPDAIADLLEQYGFTPESLQEELGQAIPF